MFFWLIYGIMKNYGKPILELSINNQFYFNNSNIKIIHFYLFIFPHMNKKVIIGVLNSY